MATQKLWGGYRIVRTKLKLIKRKCVQIHLNASVYCITLDKGLLGVRII